MAAFHNYETQLFEDKEDKMSLHIRPFNNILGSSNTSLPRPSNVILSHQNMSPNYRGNRTALQNYSANIPEELSTSVWITNLPPTCDYHQLFSMIRDTGRVFAAVINQPTGQHTTTAAKVIYFELEGRQRLQERARAGQFIVDNYVPTVVANRIRTAAQVPGDRSRVLVITGPQEIVNQNFLLAHFCQICTFDLEYIKTTPLQDGLRTMEWAFSSYRCQTERIYPALIRFREEYELAHLLHKLQPPFFEVKWGRDPCDRY
jgi:hypothetical protein